MERDPSGLPRTRTEHAQAERYLAEARALRAEAWRNAVKHLLAWLSARGRRARKAISSGAPAPRARGAGPMSTQDPER